MRREALERWEASGRKGPKPSPRPKYPGESGGTSKKSEKPAASSTRRSKVAAEEREEPPLIIDPLGRASEQRSQRLIKAEHTYLVEALRVEKERTAFLSAMKSPQLIHTPTITSVEKGPIREMCAVAMASDWHVEETVKPDKVGGRNEYNLAIAEERVARFFQGCVDLVEHHRSSGKVIINTFVLAVMGDLCTGYIHEELVESNQLSPTQTMLWLMPKIEAGIKLLLNKLKLRKLSIAWGYGNHGRTTMRSRIATGAENSYEWMLGKIIENKFADDKRVEFDINPSPHQYVEVYGKTLHFHHGDSLKYQGGVGGIGIPLLKAVPQWDSYRRADIHHIGHFHQLRDYGRAMCNGSLIGVGPFSQWIRAEYEEPQQLFYLLDSKRGKCFVTPLWVGADPKSTEGL